jgi:hypothetical protein
LNPRNTTITLTITFDGIHHDVDHWPGRRSQSHQPSRVRLIRIPLVVTSRLIPHPKSVYPTIDPKVHYDAQTFAGKIVLITGASRGIGAEIALQYARAGASLTLVARSQASLDASRDAILRERPSAQVLTFPADVRDVAKAEEAVATTVARYGRLDILVANAGVLRPMDQRASWPSLIALRCGSNS